MKISSGLAHILIAAAIMGSSTMIFAAPHPTTCADQLPPPVPERLPPPPALPPLYVLSQQTSNPAETLGAVVNNIPSVEKGKKYEVRVEIREVAPFPPPEYGSDS